jgi:hypothetical protein
LSSVEGKNGTDKGNSEYGGDRELAEIEWSLDGSIYI